MSRLKTALVLLPLLLLVQDAWTVAPARAASPAPAQHHQHKTQSTHTLRLLDVQDRDGTTVLEFQVLSADGKPVTRMETVHTKPMHLLITNAALDQLAHVHPQPQPNGNWRVEANLSHPADHLLFAEFTPRGGAPQLARATLARAIISDDTTGTTGGAPALPEAQQPAVGQYGPFQVGMYVQPGSNPQQRLVTFHISRNGNPATFTPYLGERGHAALFTTGAQRMVHAHPTQDARPGHVTFQVPVVPGERMRVFGEYIVDGQHLLTSFVMDPDVLWTPASPG